MKEIEFALLSSFTQLGRFPRHVYTMQSLRMTKNWPGFFAVKLGLQWANVYKRGLIFNPGQFNLS